MADSLRKAENDWVKVAADGLWRSIKLFIRAISTVAWHRTKRTTAAVARAIVYAVLEVIAFVGRHPQATVIAILAIVNVALIGCVVQKTMELNTTEHECYLLEERLDSAKMQNFHYVKY